MPSNNGHKQALHFDHPPRRVVSLVPSYTESLFDLGFGQAVVGITDYCIHPADKLADLPRVGGPRTPRLMDILALRPDLVLANQEENTRQAVESLEAAGVRVWVTFPRTVREALDMLWAMIAIFMDRAAAVRLDMLERTIEWAEAALESRRTWRYFCPIWQEAIWWMTFNQNTYSHDLLRLLGGKNTFAERLRRYPLLADVGDVPTEPTAGRDTRYPRVILDEIRAANPEVIILPSEPFAFNEAKRDYLCELLPDCPAVREGRVHLVDGSLLTWPGTRLAYALQELATIFPEGL